MLLAKNKNKGSNLRLSDDVHKSKIDLAIWKKRYLASFESLRTPRGIEGQRRDEQTEIETETEQEERKRTNRRFTPITAA